MPNVIRLAKSRRIRWTHNVAHMGGERRKVHNKVLVGRLEGKKSLGRPRPRKKDNIKMYLKGTGCENVDWIYVAQNRSQWQAAVNKVLYVLVPQNAGYFLSG
jgi:hypothetical protein